MLFGRRSLEDRKDCRFSAETLGHPAAVRRRCRKVMVGVPPRSIKGPRIFAQRLDTIGDSLRGLAKLRDRPVGGVLLSLRSTPPTPTMPELAEPRNLCGMRCIAIDRQPRRLVSAPPRRLRASPNAPGPKQFQDDPPGGRVRRRSPGTPRRQRLSRCICPPVC